MSNKTVTLMPFADISTYLDGFEMVSAQFGSDGRVYVLVVNRIPQRERGMFVPALLKGSYTYKILIVTEKQIDEVVLYRQTFNYHYVQPLHNHLLLVGARCTCYSAGQYDLNACVFDYEGHSVRKFLLGDGIQSVQVTENGTIWTSYFDEGVFGNYGWENPIGARGLLAWDEQGNKVYENRAADIADCYALNVVNENEVWFYYYTDFSLGCIAGGPRQAKVAFMDPKISGSSGFCTDGFHFLFDAGYGKHGTFILKKNDRPGSLTKGHNVYFMNEQATIIKPQRQDFRKNRVLLYENSLFYQAAIEELV